MENNSNKALIIVTEVLLSFSLIATFTGILYKNQSKSAPIINETPKEEQKVNIAYYLDDQYVEEMPRNNETIFDKETNTSKIDTKYRYKGYKCTNNITGKFDERTWTFNVNSTISGECKVNFEKTKYTVSLQLTNARLDENNTYDIKKYYDGEFKIIPNEGYKINMINETPDIMCSNNKVALYDEENNILRINAISSDISCMLNYSKKKLNYSIIVKNGNGAINNESTEYGEKIITEILPNVEYEYKNKEIQCTNNQVATYDGTRLTIDKLTNNTECTIEFEKAPNYSITINFDDNYKEVFTINKEDILKFGAGSEASITIKSNDEYKEPILSNCTVTPTSSSEYLNGEKTFTWSAINKNISCDCTKK